MESDTAHIGNYLVSIPYNKRIDQQQSNDKRNKTRSKEIAQALPAHHLYNIIPVCSHLIQNSILLILVNRIRCEMQSQHGHTDDEENNPGIDAEQPDTGCGQSNIIILLRPKADRINKAGVMPVRLILGFILCKQIRIAVLERSCNFIPDRITEIVRDCFFVFA